MTPDLWHLSPSSRITKLTWRSGNRSRSKHRRCETRMSEFTCTFLLPDMTAVASYNIRIPATRSAVN